MKQEILIEAVGKHLDGMAFLLNWLIATAFAMTFAGLTRQDTLEVLGVKVKSRYAFNIAALVTVVALTAILLLLLRLLSVMSSLDDAHFVDGLTKLTTHEWYFNPFSFFGNSPVAYVHATLSYFLFFVVVSLAALPLGALQQATEKYRGMVYLLLMAVLVGMAIAVWQVNSLAIDRLRGMNPELYGALREVFMWKTVSLGFCTATVTAVNRLLFGPRH